MAGAIVYYSNYGSTKQYAEWIAEETGFRLYDQRTDEIPWNSVDTVVIGCPALKMQPFLKKWIIEQWPQMEGKRVVLYTTSGAPPANPGLRLGFETAFPGHIAQAITYLPVRGRMIWNELKPMHRFFMRIGYMIEKDPQRKAEMLEDVDGVDRSAIGPIVSAVTVAV